MATKQGQTVVREGANPVAVFLAILVALAIGAGGVMFLFTEGTKIDIPAVNNPFNSVGAIVQNSEGGSALGNQNPPSLREARCPDEVGQFRFNENGVIDFDYLPPLREVESLVCTEKSAYEFFLAMSGGYNDGGENKSTTGKEWLAKWYTRLSGNPDRFEEFYNAFDIKSVEPAKTDTGELILELVWVRMPGKNKGMNSEQSDAQIGKASATAFQPASSNQSYSQSQSQTGQVLEVPTEVVPTDTPIVIVPVVPTLVPVTPIPAVATAIPTEVRSEVVATAKADALAATCFSIVGATKFWELDDLPIWNDITYLEFRWGEDGLYAMSDHVGGNGPDAHKRKFCVRQVLDAPGNSLNLGAGITATWNYAQARKVPYYGYGDWRFNGHECGANGLWLFECSAIYPTEVPPPPPPEPPPVATPRASINLDELINLFIQNKWSMQRSCEFDGSYVLIRLGACELTQNPSYWVDFSPAWDQYQGGVVWVGPCIQLNEPKKPWGGTNICISPFK